MKEIVINQKSVFVGHFCVQRAGVKWKGNAALRYDVYLILEGADLKDSIAVAYGDFLSRMSEEMERQLIELQSDDENAADADA